MNDFKKASEKSNLDKIVGQKASLMGSCYDAVRGILGKENGLEGRELTLVNTLFINVNDELASGKQKRWIRDLVKEGKLEEVTEDYLSKDQASQLIEKGKNKKNENKY